MAGIPFLTNLISTLQGSGVSNAAIPGVIGGMLGPHATIQALCKTILANSSNMAIVHDAATKLAEVPNLPSSVSGIVPELMAATSPMEVVQAVSAIETVMHSEGLGGLFAGL